jgi:hypothetical protein
LQSVGLDHRVQRECAAGLALAPAAVAAVHDQRRAGQSVTDGTAGTGAFEGFGGHNGSPVWARDRVPHACRQSSIGQVVSGFELKTDLILKKADIRNDAYCIS